MSADWTAKSGVSPALSKVLNDAQARSVFGSLRREGKTIVQCHGVFDLLHRGHVDHLEEARANGDILVVSVTSDEYVNKGPGRPIFPVEVRAMMLAALEIVDYVFVSRHPSAEIPIQTIRPDAYVKGPDYVELSSDTTGNIQREIDAVAKHGGRVIFTVAPTMSSSTIVNAAGLAHSEHLSRWLREVRTELSQDDIDSWFSKIRSLKVLVVGETIIDKYVSCEALGKTSKDPILAFLRGDVEFQLGGAIAVARHVAGLGAETTVLSRLGVDEDGAWAKNELGKDQPMSAFFQESVQTQTIVKTRFIDMSTGAKVFETYEMMDDPSTQDLEDEFLNLLDEVVNDIDLIIVADYGHGLMSEKVLKKLAKVGVTLAVNTQSNAGNRGFNSVSRYPKVDILCLNGSELQLELKKKHATISDLIPSLGLDLSARWVAVTEGSRGLALWNGGQSVTQIPAFTEQVRDRVGAGDALFATVSVLLQVGASMKGAGLFGNLAGASMVSDLGNRKTIKASELVRHAKTALK